jgi:hypothetical protein
MGKKSESGSRSFIRETQFFGLKKLKVFDTDSGSGNFLTLDLESGINIPDPQHCNRGNKRKQMIFFLSRSRNEHRNRFQFRDLEQVATWVTMWKASGGNWMAGTVFFSCCCSPEGPACIGLIIGVSMH